MDKQIRNYGPIPFLEKEGVFLREIPINRWIKTISLEKSTKDASVEENSKSKKRSNGNKIMPFTQNKTKNRHKKRDEEKKEKPRHDREEILDIRMNPNWAQNLKAWQRLFAHHTLSSIRRTVTFVSTNAPRDKLDFVLDSTYRHEEAVFPETTDVYLQPETVGQKTWRVLRNNKNIPPPGVISRGHPIRFGGIKVRPNIYNVKLGIPAPHVAQTNAGYSRREDGALYKV